eukprot:1974695-Rhodomonas_salina.3
MEQQTRARSEIEAVVARKSAIACGQLAKQEAMGVRCSPCTRIGRDEDKWGSEGSRLWRRFGTTARKLLPSLLTDEGVEATLEGPGLEFDDGMSDPRLSLLKEGVLECTANATEGGPTLNTVPYAFRRWVYTLGKGDADERSSACTVLALQLQLRRRTHCSRSPARCSYLPSHCCVVGARQRRSCSCARGCPRVEPLRSNTRPRRLRRASEAAS